MAEYIAREAASADECKHKIKTPYAKIFVGSTVKKPCYNILYFDPADGVMHIGFSSFSLDYVFKWLAEEFEIIDGLDVADVEPVRRWIPCSEGLPNDFEDVLCWYEYFRFGSFNRMFRKCGVGYQVNGHWGGEVSTGRNAKVLAWMPLPEPPKEGGGEDG